MRRLMRPKPGTIVANHDWEAIEREYRAGQLSIREIASQHGISDTAIRKKAKAKGWARDLTEQVQKRVRSETVRKTVRETDVQTAEKADDDEIIEAAAKRGAQVIDTHRTDIRTGRQLVETMFGELQRQCAEPDMTAAAVDQVADDDGFTPQARSFAMKAISLPGRATTLRDLSQSLQRLVAMERQAYSLDEKTQSDDPLNDLLQAIDGKTRGVSH